LQLSGSETLTGSGVLLYNTSGLYPGGGIQITGGGSVTLSPPTSGVYAGINIFQDRSLAAPLTVTGNGALQVTGLIYAPAAAVARLDSGEPAESVLGGLADQGVLTRFQVKRVHAGKAEGLVLGQYRVLDELGRGGFGQVYKALHTVMGRVVAIKVIAPELVE